MNFSIFDLYQQTTKPAVRLHRPYIYHKAAVSPSSSSDSMQWPDTPISPKPLRVTDTPTPESSPQVPEKVLSESPIALIGAFEEVPKTPLRGTYQYRRASNTIMISYSYAENRKYWNDLQKRMKTRPNYQKRRDNSKQRSLGKTLSTTVSMPLLNSSLYFDKLKRLNFNGDANKSLQDLGFSRRTNADRLRATLNKLEAKLQSNATPVLTPILTAKAAKPQSRASQSAMKLRPRKGEPALQRRLAFPGRRLNATLK